ncbi:MAG: NrfD/PsrC family molybdoenzyme membrane anchor subunit [Myxococcota bacterium]|nr:NrfD/PsrC family molybdoenzyme membrane anchor subunit [Myxococcota bacterium]
MAQSSPAFQDSKINRDILNPTRYVSLPWLGLLLLAVLGVGQAVFSLGYQTYVGLGVAGYQAPVFWAVYIITFVFWIGIGHAGTLISAILFLFRAKWRNAINRGAEAMTVFAVLTAALFPLIHIGRLWKFYFLIPYPNQRGLWVNFKSPLLWDVFAINTYMTISIVFFYVGLIPDIAVARDRSTGLKRVIYAILCLGWQGTSGQWKAHTRTVLHLSGLATPLVLSVHSVVSWDFAMSIIPGWHATIFAPYFVAGAIFGGFAMVLTVMIPSRRIFGLEAYITDYHFENMSRFILFTSWIVGYAYGMEYFIAWYSGVEAEQTSFFLRAFGPYWVSTWIMISANCIFPQLLWFKKLRTHVPTLFVLSVIINIGMWFERYVIIITSTSRDFIPGAWGLYIPSPVELSILAGSFCWFAMFFLLFIKFFPIIAITEVKELAIHEKYGGAH